MIVLSSWSNDELQTLIIAATGELTRRAQAMGSLQTVQSMPMGWPQQPGFSGWQQTPAMPMWQAPSPPSYPQNPAPGWMQPAPGWNSQPIASAPPPAQAPVSYSIPAGNSHVNGMGATPAAATQSSVPAPRIEEHRPAPQQSSPSAPAQRAPQKTSKPVSAELAAPPAFPQPGVDHGDACLNSLVIIYQEATEYPVELLELDANLEADLGIDSVKQMQVLGIIRERFSFELPEDMNMKALRTIREVADSIRPLAKVV